MVTRAAGWGRYNSEYELEGKDYPYEHARWTEGRNLQEAIRQMGVGGIQMEPLITDSLAVLECDRAYKMLQEKPADHLAVVFNWKS